MPTLELKNVSYAYEKGKAILSNVNAELETGKMYAMGSMISFSLRRSVHPPWRSAGRSWQGECPTR